MPANFFGESTAQAQFDRPGARSMSHTAAVGMINAWKVCLDLQGVPVTDASKKSMTNRIGLQPARNADAILDHLEKMISRTAELGLTARIQGMGRQYWIDRINVVTSEINLLSSQKQRADLLLIELRSSVRA